jgi:uncharacterized membrane protein
MHTANYSQTCPYGHLVFYSNLIHTDIFLRQLFTTNILELFIQYHIYSSRGMTRALWVGVCIALPSGAGVALSVLGGNTGSLVGVAISASLLPPAVNSVSWLLRF